MTDTDVGELQPSLVYINEAGVPEEVAQQVMGRQEIAAAIEQWMRQVSRTGQARTFDVFNRNQYKSPSHIFARMAQCAQAVEYDDILSTLADVLEGLTFQKMGFEMNDDDEQDIWNQIARDLDFDSRLREMWRDLFKISQIYVAILWGQKVYQVRTRISAEDVRRHLADVRGEGDDSPRKGNRTRRRQFPLTCPVAISLMDPTKVLPVGQLLFGQERFAYIADRYENAAFGRVLDGDMVDEVVLGLIERKYQPSDSEQQILSDLDIPWDTLWLFRRDALFRHTLTRAPYERFAALRLLPALEILELKQHLRASDRATLVGSTNFIVVIRKGSDKLPAKPQELENLESQARVVARMPILVGDHRLTVDIVTPSTDNTLIESRHQVLDSRLVFKALNSYHPTVQGHVGGSVSEMSMVVARGMENRRHQLARTLEAKLFQMTLDKNPGVLNERPSIRFTPKRIALDFNQHIVNAVLKIRDRGDLSRETMLEELDYDQDVELQRRMREEEIHDQVFSSKVPFSSPQANPFAPGQAVPPSQTGPNGGRPSGSQLDDE